MPEDFEQFALTLLLCTPSDLNRAWAVPQPDQDKILELLATYKFKNPAKMLDTMGEKGLLNSRFLFKGLADTLNNLVEAYGGTDAHPGTGQGIRLVEAIQALTLIQKPEEKSAHGSHQ